MTITIPVWLLYTMYVVGGLLAVAALFAVCALAFTGWMFIRVWRPPNW